MWVCGPEIIPHSAQETVLGKSSAVRHFHLRKSAFTFDHSISIGFISGLYDLTPALCHLDYTMSEAGGVTDFVRQYTLASGGPYCDCGYKKNL